MKKASRLRVLSLTVAEVDDMLASIKDARAIKDLSGGQRQLLEDASQELSSARRAALRGTIFVRVESMVKVLRCVSMTQRWLRDMFAEFVEKRDDS